MRAGLKSTSEQAAIVARYADLFTPEQLEVLREAAQAETGVDERERLYRLRKTCESGVIAANIAPLQDALQNAELAAQVEYAGETLPLRTASARVGVLPEYADREELGKLAMDAAAELNDRRHQLKHAREALRAELSGEPDPIRRSEEEKGVALAEIARAFADASTRLTEAYDDMRARWLDRLLGADRPPEPSSYHAPYVYRLSALAGMYSKERATDVCLATLRELGFDLEADAQHPGRPRGPAAEDASPGRHPGRPAGGRPPHHPRAGRSPGLPGAPARGRPRPPLRGLRPGAPLCLPQALPRQRPDRDLLVRGPERRP